MGKKGGGQPEAPDPYETAAAESQFNRLDTYAPSGSGVQYGYTDPTTQEFVRGTAPEGSRSAVRQIESDSERQIREILQPAAASFTEKIIGQNVDNMPDAARVKDRGTVAQDIFDRSFSMMAPGIEKSNSRLLTNLQARGIPLGGEAFNDAYGEQQRQTQNTISRLAQDSNIAAGQEQTRQFGLDSSERSNAMNEIMGLMTGNYQPNTNAPSGNAAGINIGGIVGDKYQADMAAYQSNQQQQMSTASTLGSIGAALIKSSVQFKSVEADINQHWAADVVAHMPNKVWNYLPRHAPPGDTGTHIGPMAEDFHAMTGLGRPDHISVVDYLGLMLAALQQSLSRIEILEREAMRGKIH